MNRLNLALARLLYGGASWHRTASGRINERICDMVLGHSNPNRMGTRYTDISGLPLDEWTKLPWFGRTPDGYAQLDALKGAGKRSIRDVVAELV